MAQGVPRAILTHSQRVCRAYKKAVRDRESLWFNRAGMRYDVNVIRAKFDETRKETDMRKLAAMLEATEEDLFWKEPYYKLIYPKDPDGITWDRYSYIDDFVLDHWHPWEKAAHIDYYTKREQRKIEAMDYYKTIMKKSSPDINYDTIEFPAKGPHV